MGFCDIYDTLSVRRLNNPFKCKAFECFNKVILVPKLPRKNSDFISQVPFNYYKNYSYFS